MGQQRVVVGVDPDVKTPAFAICSLAGELLEVGVLPSKLREATTVAETVVGGYDVALIVTEGQAIYPGTKVRANDIVTLARHAGLICGALVALCPTASYVMPAPMDWKGQVPKAIHQGRTFARLGILFQRTPGDTPYCYPSGCAKIARVRGAARLNKSDWKHVADAIGLALFGVDLKV